MKKPKAYYNYFYPCLLGLVLGIGYYTLSSWSVYLQMDEICDNALDDDGDGLIDLNDDDCDCEVVEPISLIPNPSFEDMNCCPDDRSQLDCAEVWIQASEPTTDYIHTCGWLGWDEFPPPFPFPDGQGIMGFRDGRVRGNNDPDRNWKEYAGACLLSPLLSDSTYKFEFDLGFVNSQRSPPINITFFGTTNCDNLPFGVGDEDFGCPTNGPGWVKLGSKQVSGGEGDRWRKVTIEVTPEDDIQAIAIGPDCPHVISPVSIYYFFDNLLLADIRLFDLKLSEVSHPCRDDFALKVPFNEEFSYQWYLDGIALIGETSAQLSQTYGEGSYQVQLDDGESCRVSVGYEHNIPILSQPVAKTICREDSYSFGDQILTESGMYVDTFTSFHGCDSIVFLNLKVLGILADTVEAKIFEGEGFQIDTYTFKQEGDHLITLQSPLGCDSLVLLRLEFYHVYFPNVFSPNRDGINDVFTVYHEDDLVQSVEITVFDRWGNILFEGDAWDGENRSKPVNPGTYVYMANIRMSDGIIRQFKGSISLLR